MSAFCTRGTPSWLGVSGNRGQNPRREGYPVELFFRDQETQDLISALSQIGCRLFNISVFVCFSINKVVLNSHIPSRFKFCSTIRSRIVSSNCLALVLPKIIFKRCVPPHIFKSTCHKFSYKGCSF